MEQFRYDRSCDNSATIGIDPKTFKAVDEKIDDGFYWNGRFRGYCFGTKQTEINSYNNAIENKKKCGILYYTL